MGLVCRLAGLGGALAVDARRGRLRVARVVRARGQRRSRLLEDGGVLVDQRVTAGRRCRSHPSDRSHRGGAPVLHGLTADATMCHMPTLLEGLRRCRPSGPGPWARASPRSPPPRATPCPSSTPSPGRWRRRWRASSPACSGRRPRAGSAPRSSRRSSSRLTPVESVAGLPPCGLVVEAVREDLEPSARCSPRARGLPAGRRLLATNTSSLDITAIAAGIPGPGRVIGLHFFNPPAAMRLVEVIGGAESAAEVLEAATELDARLGQGAGAVHVDPRVHRQPRGPPVLRRGPADARGRGRRPRHPRRALRARPASGWVPSS